ncbi:MAG: hypothetical protein OXJ52_05750 [Oligoflexia bacterium]|nr:hypothetical protein [Oligoflexia bacterium]
MNISKNALLISLFLIKEGFSQSLKNLKRKTLLVISFFVVPFFYSPFIFSDAYKGASNLRVSQTENQSHVRGFSSSLAGDRRETGECPFLPEIVSQVVYQSVQAPQIEPLAEETDPYKDYDLVANKPAVVLLSLKPPENIKEEEEYTISLKVEGQQIEEAKCSKGFNKITITTTSSKFSLNKKSCKLEGKDFRRNIERVKKKRGYIKRVKEEDIHNLNIFVEIPTGYKGAPRSLTKKLSVFITSQENQFCSFQPKNFSVTIRKTSPLHLNFINLTYNPYKVLSSSIPKDFFEETGKHCEENIEVSDYDIINQFANSKEVKEYFPMMYPIGEDQVSSGALTEEFVFGTCNNNYYSSAYMTEGVIFDIMMAGLTAEWIYIRELGVNVIDQPSYRAKEGFSSLNRKLIVIVSEEYMKYHEQLNTAGFMLKPSIKDNWPIGSWNVAFVNEEALANDESITKQKLQGTVLHEVARILGQEKEYYAERYKTGPNKDDPLPDDQQIHWCRKFSNEKSFPCYKYEIFGGLMASFKNRSWRFINGRTPFMNDKSTRLFYQGIDRETFQKLFQTLHHKNFDPTKSWKQAQAQQISPVVFLSGLYDKKRGIFYNGFSMVHEKAFPSRFQETGNLEALLAKKIEFEDSVQYEILSRVYPPTEMELEILFKKGEERRWI